MRKRGRLHELGGIREGNAVGFPICSQTSSQNLQLHRHEHVQVEPQISASNWIDFLQSDKCRKQHASMTMELWAHPCIVRRVNDN